MLNFLGIHWAAPHRLVLLPLFIIIAVLVIQRLALQKKAVLLLGHRKHLSKLLKNFSLTKQYWKAGLLIASLMSIFIALLLPQWGKKDENVIQAGRDVVIILDISRSMLANDYKPNRLEWAKFKIRKLLENLKSERVGLIIFSGSAMVMCPLTHDYSSFLTYLNQVVPELVSSSTTSLDAGILKAIDIFAQVPERKNKLAVVITDGEDFSTDLQYVKNRAAKEGVTLLALGVGTIEGAPVPRVDALGYQIGIEQDANGVPILTKLNEPLLKEIVAFLKGHYVRSTTDDTDVQSIVNCVERYEKEAFSERAFSFYEHRYHWFLLTAWVCLLLEWVL